MDWLPKSELPAGAGAVLAVGANRPNGFGAAELLVVVAAGAGLKREPAAVAVVVAGLPRLKSEEPPAAGCTLVP